MTAKRMFVIMLFFLLLLGIEIFLPISLKFSIRIEFSNLTWPSLLTVAFIVTIAYIMGLGIITLFATSRLNIGLFEMWRKEGASTLFLRLTITVLLLCGLCIFLWVNIIASPSDEKIKRVIGLLYLFLPLFVAWMFYELVIITRLEKLQNDFEMLT